MNNNYALARELQTEVLESTSHDRRLRALTKGLEGFERLWAVWSQEDYDCLRKDWIEIIDVPRLGDFAQQEGYSWPSCIDRIWEADAPATHCLRQNGP